MSDWLMSADSLSSIHSATAIVRVESSVTDDSLVKSLNDLRDTGLLSLEEPAMSPMTDPIIPLIIYEIFKLTYNNTKSDRDC